MVAFSLHDAEGNQIKRRAEEGVKLLIQQGLINHRFKAELLAASQSDSDKRSKKVIIRSDWFA